MEEDKGPGKWTPPEQNGPGCRRLWISARSELWPATAINFRGRFGVRLPPGGQRSPDPDNRPIWVFGMTGDVGGGEGGGQKERVVG